MAEHGGIQHGDIPGIGKHALPDSSLAPTFSNPDGFGKHHLNGAEHSPAPENQAILTPSQERARDIAFNGHLLRLTSLQVRHVIRPYRQKHTRAVLADYDAMAHGDLAEPTNPVVGQIAVDLVGIGAQLEDDASKWEPIHERHAILNAVYMAQKSDKKGFYVDQLYQRTGLTEAEVKAMREEIPPWQETEKVLTGDQKLAAEAVASELFLNRCLELARQSERDQTYPDIARINKNTARLIKAFLSIKFDRPIDDPEVEAYRQQAESLMPEVEDIRNKIFDKAQVWDEEDMHRKVRITGKKLRHLEEPAFMEELTGVTPEQYAQAKKKGTIEMGKTAVGTVLNEGVSYLAGVVAAENNLGKPVMEAMSHNTPAEIGITAGLYLALTAYMVKNTYLSANLLDKVGFSLDPGSKHAYDHAIDNARNKAVWGGLRYHGAFELGFIALGAYYAQKHGLEAGLEAFNGASIAGLAKNAAQHLGGETALGIIGSKQRGKELENYRQMNSFVPNK